MVLSRASFIIPEVAMRLTNKAKRVVAAFVAATLVVALASFGLTNIGGDGPSGPFAPLAWVGLILLFPATIVGGALGYGASIAIPVLGFLQYFIIFWYLFRKRWAHSEQ